ncbi:MAG: c-type cytochrome [Luminiphilus sp.]
MSLIRYLAVAGLTVAVALPTGAHIEKTEPMQSLRQSYFALLGMTFGPMADMVKGKIEWDDATFQRWASDLEGVSGYQVERGFAPGTEEGMTRAKPEIWLNTEDFNAKLADFRREAGKLASVAAEGDRAAISAQFGATGKTCKACHDEYKSKDYLY